MNWTGPEAESGMEPGQWWMGSSSRQSPNTPSPSHRNFTHSSVLRCPALVVVVTSVQRF